MAQCSVKANCPTYVCLGLILLRPLFLQLAENYDAPQLAKACVLHALEHYKDLVRACYFMSSAPIPLL